MEANCFFITPKKFEFKFQDLEIHLWLENTGSILPIISVNVLKRCYCCIALTPFCVYVLCRVQWTLCLVIDLSLGVPPTILYHWYNIKSRSFGCYSRWESGIPYVFQTWFFFPGFCLLLLFPISLAVRWKLSTKVPVRAFHARFAE